MDDTGTIINPKLAFRWRAVWFSLFAPLGSILILFLGTYFLNKQTPIAFHSSEQLLAGGLFLIQVTSLAAGIFGMFTKGVLAKILCLVGILISCLAGFVVFVVWSIFTYGIGC